MYIFFVLVNLIVDVQKGRWKHQCTKKCAEFHCLALRHIHLSSYVECLAERRRTKFIRRKFKYVFIFFLIVLFVIIVRNYCGRLGANRSTDCSGALHEAWQFSVMLMYIFYS